MHNDPFLYIIKYIYIFICIMLLCKGKKTSYIALENYVYTVLFRTSSYQIPMYHWCFPLFFCIPPPQILIKSNQTFQIIERIYTAPYLLFIIINYYPFYKKKILEAKYIKLPCLSVSFILLQSTLVWKAICMILCHSHSCFFCHNGLYIMRRKK